MGLDLKLLPFYNTDADCRQSFDVLTFERNQKLFDALMELEKESGVDVPRGGIRSYVGSNGDTTETCYGKTEFSRYGERLKTLTAGEIYPVLVWEVEKGEWKNEAIRAFLKFTPDDLPIVLYWC